MVKLGHFVFMAGFAHGCGGRVEDVRFFMLNGAGVIGIYFMTVAARYFGGGHGAVPVLLNNAGGVALVALHTVVVAVGQLLRHDDMAV